MINNVSMYFHCCLPSHVRLFAAPCTAARQASLSLTVSQSLPKSMSIELVMYFHKENEIYWKTMWFEDHTHLLLLVTFFPPVKHAMLLSFSGYLSLLLYSFYPECFSLKYTLVSFSHLNLYVVPSERLYLIVLSKIAHPCLWETNSK